MLQEQFLHYLWGKVRTAHPALLRCGQIYSFARHIVELMEMGRESVFEGSFLPQMYVDKR